MNQAYFDLLTILDQPEFQILAQKDSQTPLSWNDLTTCPLPYGWSVRETYEALFALRRYRGIYIPRTYKSMDFKVFYTLSGTFMKKIIKLASLTSANSPLYQQLRQKESYRFKQKSILREVQSTAMLDDLNVDNEIIESIVHGYRTPSNVNEIIVVNTVSLLSELEKMFYDTFNESLLLELYRKLTIGVVEKELDHILPQENRAVHLLSQQEFYDYINDISKNVNEPSIVTALFIREQIQYMKPFPHLNYTMSWIIFRLYSIKHDHPVLAYLPSVYTTLEWASGKLPQNALSFYYSDETDSSPMKPDLTIMGTTPKHIRQFISVQEQKSTVYKNEGDISRYLITNIEILLYAIKKFQEELHTDLVHFHEVTFIDTSFNYRQNAVILKARQDPKERFYIRVHQNVNKIAYATARADLLDLAKKGYLKQQKEGKQFYFIAGKRILGE